MSADCWLPEKHERQPVAGGIFGLGVDTLRILGHTVYMTNTDTTTATTFQVGQTVTARSAGDSDCVWTFLVTRRTARFVTLVEQGTGDVHRVKVLDDAFTGGEWARPFGSYSMAPVVRPGR